MHQKAIAHTAELIKAAALCSGTTIPDTTRQIGVEKVARLLHNSPMNQLLDFSRVVREVVHDCDLHRGVDGSDIKPDVAYGNYIASIVTARTNDHHKYANTLYNILAGKA